MSRNRRSAIVYLLMLFYLYLCNPLLAQDSIRVRKTVPGDEYCWPVIAAGQQHAADSLSFSILQGDNSIELRINDECPAKKKADVFVASFEITVDTGSGRQSIAASSSFFSGPQRKLLLTLRPGQEFMVKNIVIHAPDGFRKMDNFKVTLTN